MLTRQQMLEQALSTPQSPPSDADIMALMNVPVSGRNIDAASTQNADNVARWQNLWRQERNSRPALDFSLGSPGGAALVVMGGAAAGGAFRGAPAAGGAGGSVASAASGAAGGAGGSSIIPAAGSAGGMAGAPTGGAASGSSGISGYISKFGRFLGGGGGGRSRPQQPQTLQFVDRSPPAPTFAPINRPKTRRQILADVLANEIRGYS